MTDQETLKNKHVLLPEPVGTTVEPRRVRQWNTTSRSQNTRIAPCRTEYEDLFFLRHNFTKNEQEGTGLLVGSYSEVPKLYIAKSTTHTQKKTIDWLLLSAREQCVHNGKQNSFHTFHTACNKSAPQSLFACCTNRVASMRYGNGLSAFKKG